MANRFKKMIQPLLDEARREGYKAGHEQGMKDGFQKKTLAYENEIECLKTLVAKLAERIPAVPGPEIADPNIMELCFHNGERHMKGRCWQNWRSFWKGWITIKQYSSANAWRISDATEESYPDYGVR